MKRAEPPGRRSRALGEQHEPMPAPETIDTRLDQRAPAVVADVAGAADDPPQERITPGGALHHAVGLRHARNEEHDVDECRVIRDDDEWISGAQPIDAVPLDTEQSQGDREAHPEATRQVDDPLGAPFSVARQPPREGEDAQRSDEGPGAEDTETQPGAERPPYVSYSSRHGMTGGGRILRRGRLDKM